jgi:hypothetical protein
MPKLTEVFRIIEAQLPADVGFDFDWSDEKVWNLPGVATTSVPVSVLDWHLDTPFWDYEGENYCLSPRQVLDDPGQYGEHASRIKNAQLNYPIDVMKDSRGKLTILDGLHRFVKAMSDGQSQVTVREIPRSRIPEICED